MHDPVLVQPSGDGDIDQAVVTCASGTRALATSANPGELTWVLGYYWRPGWSGFAPASPDGKAAGSCQERPFDRPSENVAAKDTVISYVIGTDGLVKDVAVAASSGVSDLDRQAVNCAAAWHFFPVYRNGNAVTVARTYTVRWQLR